MTIEILMPALSPTMEEGTLAKWLVNEGDSISSGDLIAEIETDKATMEVEAVDDGKIGQLLVPAGTEGVKVNTPIALLIDSTELPHASIKNIADKPYLEKEKIAPELKMVKPITLEPNSSIITVREALRNAMAEEMRSDKNVFVMGEEVAEYQGAYKVTQGLLDEFGDKRVYDTSAGDNLSDRGKAYGIKSEIVDGMDIIAVRDAAIRAIEYCRSGKGPYILEMKTYRYRGHSMSDPAKYRTRDEVEKIRKTSDPIENIKILLNKMGVEDKALKDIDVKIKSKIADAAKFAQDSPEPSEAELYTDITIN